MKTLLLSLPLICLAFGSDVQAITLWGNAITGTNPGQVNPYTAGQTLAADLTVSGISRGAGVVGANAANRYNASGWSTGGMGATDYFSFILTPGAGFQLSLTSFLYAGQNTGSGPTSFAFRSSLDGFTSNIGTPTVSGTTLSLSGLQFQGLTGPIEFRFYGWGAGNASGKFSIDSFSFNGSVNSVAGVPESGPGLAAFACAAGMLMLARQRRIFARR